MDKLDDLPIDDSYKSTPAEVQVLKKYFSSAAKNIPSRTWEELKCIIVATILFLGLSTSFFDTCIGWLPYTDHIAVKIGLKALIFATLLYVGIVMLS